jgi:hypothetical protein
MRRTKTGAVRWVVCRVCKPNRPNNPLSAMQATNQLYHCIRAWREDPERKLPNLTMAVETAARYHSLDDTLKSCGYLTMPECDIITKLYPTQET